MVSQQSFLNQHGDADGSEALCAAKHIGQRVSSVGPVTNGTGVHFIAPEVHNNPLPNIDTKLGPFIHSRDEIILKHFPD